MWNADLFCLSDKVHLYFWSIILKNNLQNRVLVRWFFLYMLTCTMFHTRSQTFWKQNNCLYLINFFSQKPCCIFFQVTYYTPSYRIFCYWFFCAPPNLKKTVFFLSLILENSQLKFHIFNFILYSAFEIAYEIHIPYEIVPVFYVLLFLYDFFF